MVREGLKAVFSGEPDIEILGDCGDGEQAVRLTAELPPDVALLDLRTPVVDGAAATARIVAAGSTAVLILTTYDTDGDITRALNVGGVCAKPRFRA